MQKSCLIIGTRPQLIKAQALKFPNMFVINTGQHYKEMNDLYQGEIKYNLKVGSHSPCKQMGIMLTRLEKVLLKEKPELVIVIGDTNSTLAGALTAKKLNIPVCHIEAGLRSYDNIPEETNRVLTDHLSTYLFCPTHEKVLNLRKEGITQGVYHTGDIMADLVKGTWKPKDYILMTIHRPENTDNPNNLRKIVADLQDKKVIWPIHPRTRKALKKYKIDTGTIKVIDPVSFKEMIKLEEGAVRIVTDSGGVQRDAYLLGIPCEIRRSAHEWPELKGKAGLLGNEVGKEMTAIIKEVL